MNDFSRDFYLYKQSLINPSYSSPTGTESNPLPYNPQVDPNAEYALQQQYLSQPRSSLQRLAELYQLPNQQALIAQREDVVALALRGGVEKFEGWAPAGHVMADDIELDRTDSLLRALIPLVLQYCKGDIAPPTHSVALEQVRKYGEERYAMLSAAEKGLYGMQKEYARALEAARNRDGNLDVAAFTAEFSNQPGHELFKALYKNGREVVEPTYDYNPNGDRYVSGESHSVQVTVGEGEHAQQLILAGDRFVAEYNLLVQIDLNNPPNLHKPNAVTFHPALGWVTSGGNLDEGDDLFGQVVITCIIIVASIVSYGLASGWAAAPVAAGEAGATGGAIAGTAGSAAATPTGLGLGPVASGAVGGFAAGLTGSTLSGAISGHLDWRDVIKGAVLGAIGGGLSAGISDLAQSMTTAELAAEIRSAGGALPAANVPLSQISPTGTFELTAATQRLVSPEVFARLQQQFQMIRTVLGITQSVTMSALGGGSIENGLLAGIGVQVGANVSSAVTQALSNSYGFDTDVARFMGRAFGAIATASLVEAGGGNGLLALVSTATGNLVSGQIIDSQGQRNTLPQQPNAEAIAQLPNESLAETIRLNRPTAQPTSANPPVVSTPATSALSWTPINYGYQLNRAGYYDLDNATSASQIFSGLAGISSTGSINGTNGLGAGFHVEDTYGTVYGRSSNLLNASGNTVMRFDENQWTVADAVTTNFRNSDLNLIGQRVTTHTGEVSFSLANNDGSLRQVTEQQFDGAMRQYLNSHGVGSASYQPTADLQTLRAFIELQAAATYKEVGVSGSALTDTQSAALVRNAGQLGSVRAALGEQALAAQSQHIAAVNSAPATSTNNTGNAELPAVIVRGTRLPTDAQGNSYEQNAAGQVLVHFKGGGTLALNAESSLVAAAAMRLAGVSGTLAGDLTLGVSLSAALRTLGSWITEGLTTALKLPFEALVLMTIPSNVGQSTQITELDNYTRFEQRPGALFGRLMVRDTSNDPWMVGQDNVIKVETATGFAIVSAEDMKRLSGPLTSPLPAPQPIGAPPLIAAQGETNSTTTYPTATPIVPSTTATPIPAQRTVEDLIVEARNASEQKRFRDRLIDEAKRLDPSFDPTGYDAHHIFKLNGGSVLMQQTRANLQRLGLDLNDLANGVLLPGSRTDQGATGAYHPRLDNDLYNDTVIDELRQATSADEARDILKRIGNQLRANDYPGIRPRGGQ
jgi:A nuclease family of the HNH/ENDO VII superfamily with conserved AHH